MCRPTFGLYGLILLETLVYVALVPLAPTYARDLGLSRVETGALLAAASFATLAVSFPVGLLADRIGARAVTVASGVLFVLSCLGQGLAGDFWTLMISRAAFGVALGVVWTAGVAWLAESARGSQATALGAAVTVSGLGFAAGPAFAGLLADHFGTGVPFYACGAAGGLALLALGSFESAPSPTEHRPLLETLRAARRDVLVVASLALIALLGFVSGGINLLVPLHLRGNGASAGEIGVVFSGAAVIFTVVSALVARRGDRMATVAIAGICTLAFGLSLLIVVGSGATAAAIAFVLVRAPFWATMDTIMYPLGAAGAERAAVGRGAVLGILNLVWGVAATAGPLVTGGVADAAGERGAYVFLIAICGAAGLWMLRTAQADATSDTVLLAERQARG